MSDSDISIEEVKPKQETEVKETVPEFLRPKEISYLAMFLNLFR